MIKITTQNATETRVHHWTTEASCLGLPVGKFPQQIETDLGNGQPFLCTSVTAERATYRQNYGCLELTIYND